jgi:hypothetical protein
LVVARECEFELRLEGKIVLPHEPRRDPISAGELLDPGLGPLACPF